MPTNKSYIAGEWVEGQGEDFYSLNPCTGEIIWKGKACDAHQVQRAAESAAYAFKSWSRLTLQKRIDHLQKAHDAINSNKEQLVEALSEDTGKPLWEAHSEIAATLGKFAISFKAYNDRCAFLHSEQPHASISTRHKPHGPVGVLGPYNFPIHLPNGHIVPALLAGNTVVYKPSELTPLASEVYVKCWQNADLPPGVLNLVQGGANTGIALSSQPLIRGLFFTGSWTTGRKLMAANVDFPQRILALEMGGNNPLIVWGSTDHERAAAATILSSFITTGQRCSCARRLIIPNNDEGLTFLSTLMETTKKLIIGPPTQSPQPFMGPLISTKAATGIWDAYQELLRKGAKPLLSIQQPQSAFISPAILDCTECTDKDDCEHFGPLLKVFRVDSFEKAIETANETEYGLCAGIITDKAALYHQFWQESRAGIVNWNTPLTGASSQAPFGGTGKSGNYRPSAYYAADYCAYPVASMESPVIAIPSWPPGLPEPHSKKGAL